MFWITAAVLIWGGIHSILASRKAKELAQNWLGSNLVRYYRLAYNLLAGLSFLFVLAIVSVTPDRILYIVPLPWSIPMILGEILAVITLLVGFRQTDAMEFLGLRQLKSTKPMMIQGEPLEVVQGHLVTTGLYHYVRHPLYSAGMAFIWLMPLMTKNVLAINIGLTIYVVAGAYLEERKLRSDFGREYLEYAAITPMFIPFLKGNKSHH